MTTTTPANVDGALRNVTTNADQLGITLPAAFTRDAATLAEIPQRLANYRHNRAAFVESVYAALAADTDPSTDPAVLGHAVRAVLFDHHTGQAVSELSARKRAEALAKHAPALVKCWRPVVEDAAAVLARVVDALPAGTDLADARTVTHLRPPQMSVWGEGREAVDRLAKVVASWTALTTGAGLVKVEAKHRPLILAPLSAEQLAGIGHDTARVHEAGVPLDLATPEDYAARVARVAKETREAQEAAQARAQEALTGRRKQRQVTVAPFGG